MNIEFATFTLPREDALEMHRALFARYIMENALRHEQGLEATDPPPILMRLQELLGISDDEAHALFHALEDELWAFSWYSYTDEWAWFRARQDVLKQLGGETKRIKRTALERLIEKRYEEKFEDYVAEVDMHGKSATKKRKKKQQ